MDQMVCPMCRRVTDVTGSHDCGAVTPLTDVALTEMAGSHAGCAPQSCATRMLLDEVARLRWELARRDAQDAWTHQAGYGSESPEPFRTTATPGVATWHDAQPGREMGDAP